ncbi:MAG TPA: LysM domain-containing protein, partial [Anaerolineae bacterium]
MILGLGLALWFGLAPVVSLAAGSGPTSPTGDYYIVQPGDTWANIAARNGLTASKLMAANPALLRPRSVIRPGDRMFIPLGARPAATSATGYWYTVKPGDSWQTVSRDTGVAVLDLWHANPSQLRPNRWLYIGTRLWIPAAAPAAGLTEPSMETAPEVATASPEGATPQVPVATTEPMTATAPITAPAAPRASATPSASTAATPAAGACPASLASYDVAIGARLNAPSAGVDALKSWLTQCGAVRPTAGSVTVAAIRAAGSHDVVVVLSDPAQTQPDAPGRLLVYHALANGYVLTGVAQGQGKVTVLRVGDLNADGKTDIVWTDAVCGPSVCYSTLFVDSWTGNNYQSWLQEQPITANAQYNFQSMAGASGLAIVITGTVGSSVAAPSTGAGARTFTESWISQKGGLYHRAVLIAVPAVAATPAESTA